MKAPDAFDNMSLSISFVTWLKVVVFATVFCGVASGNGGGIEHGDRLLIDDALDDITTISADWIVGGAADESRLQESAPRARPACFCLTRLAVGAERPYAGTAVRRHRQVCVEMC